MKIDESVIEKNFVLEKDDPYGFSIKFMDIMSGFGSIFERKNEYMTDGPEHKSRVEFDVIGVMDKFSRIQISVFMESLQKKLSVNIAGNFDVDVEESGFMSSLLSEYYLENMYHPIRKFSIEKLKSAEKFIEENLS